jgi:protease-4
VATVQNIRDAFRWAADTYVLFIVIGVVIGLTLAPVAFFVSSSSGGTVAVVPLGGTIDGGQAAAVSGMLQEAREDPDVEAVVIIANSGGGSAVASEELYMQTKRTAEEMPVITVVAGGSLSGAYHMIAPSDHIYVKPASVVGSVGVVAQLPRTVEPNSIVGTTGPNKLTGSGEREFLHRMETVQNSFVAAIYEHREDRIELTRGELTQAGIYGGAEAVQNGLADEIGDRQIAMEHAAEMAGLEDHQVSMLRSEDATAQFMLRSTYLASDAPNKEMVDPSIFIDENAGAPTFLMVPPGVLAGADTDRQFVGMRDGTVAPVSGSAGDDAAAAETEAATEIADGDNERGSTAEADSAAVSESTTGTQSAETGAVGGADSVVAPTSNRVAGPEVRS